MLNRTLMTFVVCLSLMVISTSATSQSRDKQASATPNNPPYNIILIISDQETSKLAATKDYQLPARQAFMSHGVTFRNHYTAAAMCSPSRAAFLTGTPPQVNGVFDQMEYSYVPALNPDRPNLGSVLKSLGYRTVYFGKFEMNRSLLLNLKDTINYSTLARPYGFDEFNPTGDANSSQLRGFKNDVLYVGDAVHWLRQNFVSPNNKQQPFFMVVSILNPHDIMYADVNIPNTPLAQKPMASVIFPPPASSIYAKQWQFDLPTTMQESLTAPGMPSALLEYQKGWAGFYGFIPIARKDMWIKYYNYYLNAIQDNDQTLQLIVNAMNEMNLWKNTIVIVTADHGEMGGAHGGLRGKGPMAYEQNAHIPLIIAHPKAPQGASCSALTSHLDLLPTVIGLTGLPEKERVPAMKGLAGHDFSSLLTNPEKADVHAIRPAVLFNFVGLSTIDANYQSSKMMKSFLRLPMPLITTINLSKRGFMSFIFDGRYKFARYYAPNAFNAPKTLEQITRYNDIQLFDLQTDPDEAHNLALDIGKNQDTILRMNQLMNEMIAKEVGVNDGGFLPESVRP